MLKKLQDDKYVYMLRLKNEHAKDMEELLCTKTKAMEQMFALEEIEILKDIHAQSTDQHASELESLKPEGTTHTRNREPEGTTRARTQEGQASGQIGIYNLPF